MIGTATAKEISISLGLYGVARVALRSLDGSMRRQFRSHRALLGQFVTAGDIAFDVGANIGHRTEVLLSLGASVVAFEPQAECARKVLALRNKRLTVVQKAVGDVEGVATLHIKRESLFSSLISDWPGSDDVRSVDVQVTTLDSAINLFGLPAYCKIDVEGFEPQVLRGLSHRIPALSFEYHCHGTGPDKVMECLGLLSKMGGYRANLTAHDDADLLFPDWVSIEGLSARFPACALNQGWGDIYVTL